MLSVQGMNIWALKKLTSNIHLLHKYLLSVYDALNEILGNRDILVMKSDQNYILGRSERKQTTKKIRYLAMLDDDQFYRKKK